MDIISAVIVTVSDDILLFSQILILSLIANKKYSKSRCVISLIAAAAIGFIAEIAIHSVTTENPFLSFFLYFIRLPLFTLFTIEVLSFKYALISLIIQFLCSIINSAVIAVLPDEPLFKYLSFMAIPLCLLVSVLLFRRKHDSLFGNAILSIPTHIFFIILITLFIESGLIDLLSCKTDKIESQVYDAKVMSLLLIICIAVLIISLIISVVFKNHYNSLNNMLRDQVKLQITHYEKKEKINSELRSFKHDFNNHIKCLESLMNADKHDEAKCYLEKMTGMMPASEFMFSTGNYIADAILSGGHEAASADGITIDFSGSIPPSIDSTDLCILLSNSLNNAIEACQPISGSRTITICAAFQQGIFVLIMKNPTLHKGQAKDIFPQTTKSDKSSHGFGLENIRKVVCRYDGIVHTSIDNGWFTINVSLKI